MDAFWTLTPRLDKGHGSVRPGRYDLRQGNRPSMAEGELARVLGFYDLGDLKTARWVDRGFVNDNWVLETDQGRYFLKRRHPAWRQPALVSAQHDLLRWLRRERFPAPSVVPLCAGATYLTLEGEVYEIQQYIESESFDHHRPQHLDAAARTLGRYHACVEGFASPALCDLGDLYNPAILSDALSCLCEAWAVGQDVNLAPVIRQLERHATLLAARFESHGDLPGLIIHGDYYADNLLFDGDRVVGVVDYDKACWQPRVVDLAEALIYFGSTRPGRLRHVVYPGFLEWAPFERFARGYCEAVTLSTEETEALPDYVACIWVQVSFQRLLERRSRPARAIDALQEVLALADWADAHAGRMTASLEELA
jgi:homoserine kinase type II